MYGNVFAKKLVIFNTLLYKIALQYNNVFLFLESEYFLANILRTINFNNYTLRDSYLLKNKDLHIFTALLSPNEASRNFDRYRWVFIFQ